jgi:hypothetical protein
LSETPSFPRQLASAATLAALFTALALAELRFEGYETEKHVLLVIPSAVIVAAGVLRFLTPHPPTPFPVSEAAQLGREGEKWHGFFSPSLNSGRRLGGGVLLFLLSAALSTVFSLDPAQSLFGAPNRGQGLLAICCYVLLFAGALWTGRTLLFSLLPAVVMIGVPVALYALLLRFNGIERPGSTMGNPNFLAAWLTPAILFVVHGLWAARQSNASRRMTLGLGVVLVLMGAALLVTTSRGALLGLGAGAGVSALAYAAIIRSRRLTASLGLLLLAALMMYTLAGTNLRGSAGIARLFQPLDPFRREAWSAAVDLLREIHLPLLDAVGNRDPFASIRPLVGYGVDALPLTQSRFGYVTTNTIFVDSFHNLIFDSLATTGALGLGAWLALYLGATGAALHALGLLTRAQVAGWLLIQAGGAAVGALALVSIPLPIGAALGLGGGTAVWLAVMAFRRDDNPALPSGVAGGSPVVPLQTTRIVVIGLLGIVVAHWTALQFAFPTASSSPLIWVLLGLLASLSTKQKAQQTEPLQLPITPGVWAGAALASGVVLIASLGTSVETPYVRHAVGTAELPLLLLVVGGMCTWFVGQRRPLISVGVVWLVWAILEEVITRVAGNSIDWVLLNNGSLVLGFAPLALKGVGGALLTLIAWGWYSGVQPRWFSMGIVSLCVLGSAAFYTTNLLVGLLHGVGGSYAALGRADADALARRFYEAGIQESPLDTAVRLDLVKISPVNSPAADELVSAHPYIVHSLDWMRLLDQAIALRGQPPTSMANVIRNGGFDLGVEHWFTYGDLDSRIENDRFVFRDLGTEDGRAVVFQETGVTASIGVLRAQLDLASDRAAEVSVLIHSQDWSQQYACLFRLTPGTPLQAAVVVSVAAEWEDVHLAIYSLTDDAAITVDNVALWNLSDDVGESACTPVS